MYSNVVSHTNYKSIIFICLSAFSTITFCAERDAEKIFNDFCFTCHGTGWEGAPVIGDSFTWKDRVDQGLDVLLENTINGINTMPAKGTCMDCSDEELKAVIEFLIAE